MKVEVEKEVCKDQQEDRKPIIIRTGGILSRLTHKHDRQS